MPLQCRSSSPASREVPRTRAVPSVKIRRCIAESRGAVIRVADVSSDATPGGDYTVRLGFTWERSSVTAPAGEDVYLVLHGQGPAECRIVTPGATGHVLVDGVPLRPGAIGDWC